MPFTMSVKDLKQVFDTDGEGHLNTIPPCSFEVRYCVLDKMQSPASGKNVGLLGYMLKIHL